MPNLGVPASTFDSICTCLRSVLENDKPEDLVRFHHQTFVDFLVSHSCRVEFRVDLESMRAKITLACLQTLQTRLRFNICDIGSSYLLNRDVHDLATRVEDCIPASLARM